MLNVQSTSVSQLGLPPRLRFSRVTWGPDEAPGVIAAEITSSLRSVADNSQSHIPFPIPPEPSLPSPVSPLRQSSAGYPSAGLTQPPTLSEANAPGVGESVPMERPHECSVPDSRTLSPQFESEQQLESHSEDSYDPVRRRATSEPTPTPQSPPPSPSLPSVSRPPLANIAPGPPSQEQRAWMLPCPLPAVMAAPFHRVAVVSQVPSHKRRRRRCAVCVQLGKEEASFECPGRGDRTRCGSLRSGKGADLSVFKLARNDKEFQKSALEDASGSRHDPGAFVGSSSSPDLAVAVSPSESTLPFALVPHMCPHAYVPVMSYGHPLQPGQQIVLASGDGAKRRARRCIVCVTLGKEGTQCPGRGNRLLCPDFDAATDVPPVRKWKPVIEQ